MRAEEGTYALKIYRANRWSTAQVAWEQDLAAHLLRADLTDTVGVPLRDGRLVGEIASPEGTRPFALTEWATAPKPTPPFSDELYRSFGAVVAGFHSRADGLRSAHPLRPFDALSALDAPRRRVRDALTALERRADADLVEVEGQRTVDALAELESRGLPRGIRHGDASLDNVRLTADGMRLHDFDLSGEGWPMSDLVGALSTPFAAAFLSGYRSVRSITDVELDALPALRAAELLRNLDFHLTDKVAIRGEESVAEGWVDAELDALRVIHASRSA
ncbi:phosphotransferase enzyme family protein [Planctomonas psychrotolerans]|uniref:phosphotransferase enzyme family protein n=1 Tax=Planctomonas psychrotolerans TaxID=2528712 RepID=UPI00123C3C4D|nr:phosphotransferase [Planctomonas psychrotolerans]